ncbi:MAG: hypothetical protein AB1489_09060 [Acidobacteriota bacterium]
MSKNELIDLNQHFSCWRGFLIPTAFAELLQGISSEQQRLNNKRFLVTLFCVEYDYEGLIKYIDLLDGFNDLEEATAFAKYRLDSYLEQMLHKSRFKESPLWTLVEPDIFNRLDRDPVDTIKRVYHRSFKLSDGSEYNSVYCHFEIIETPSDSVINEELFKFLNCQSELILYFIDIGRISGKLLR